MFGSGLDGRRARPRPHRLTCSSSAPTRWPPTAALMTAPDMRGRLRAIRARGGKVVVVDPRRTRTAGEADEHHFIRPGTDALLLFALVHVLFDEGLADPRALAAHVAGLDDGPRAGRRASRPRTWPRRAGSRRRRSAAWRASWRRAPSGRGLRADRHRRRSASARSRAGSSTCSTSLTGNLDRPGGAMFPRTAVGSLEHRRRARTRPRRRASGAGTAACAGSARSSASCRRRAWPRRSRRRARARSAR